MGKISPLSAKYIINTSIDIEGVVDKPDVIGAVFGQTEGLLGPELELRELQRSGRIGRIEVDVDTRNGKTGGKIIIPSSLDKAETAIVAASLEIIQRIGPCNAKVNVLNIEDVRVAKRMFVINRAKELLRTLTESVLPDSRELADEVAYSVRVMEIQEYGKDRLPAGPSIADSNECILVEGRADVVNLLKHGIKNAIAMNGTSVPQTIIDLSKEKIVTVFVDGDRGGNLILKELLEVADIDFVTRAPDGKEVEEITQKEIHKALRSRIAIEQAKMELSKELERNQQAGNRNYVRQLVRSADMSKHQEKYQDRPQYRQPASQPVSTPSETSLHPDMKKAFSTMLDDLVGTRGAYLLDDKLTILGKVPVTELVTTLKSLTSGVYAIIFDGVVDRLLTQTAERSNVKYLIGMDSKIRSEQTRLGVLTVGDLG